MEISVTPELEEYVANKVATGCFSSASEVFEAGLQALRAEEQDIDQWLIEEVGPAYDEMQAHPERAIPIAKVFADLRQYHEDRLKTLV
jgi:putative addiction module CopG family antidote